MRRLHEPARVRQWRARDRVDAEVVEERHRTADVDERVDGADLVELDVVGRHAVHFSLSRRKARERRQCSLACARRKSGACDPFANVRVRPVLSRLVAPSDCFNVSFAAIFLFRQPSVIFAPSIGKIEAIPFDVAATANVANCVRTAVTSILAPARAPFVNHARRAGPKSIRAVGQYVKDHDATVTAFYLSNVEQYLYQDGKWTAFCRNVATFPLDPASTFIRTNSGRGVGFGVGFVTSLGSISAEVRECQ